MLQTLFQTERTNIISNTMETHTWAPGSNIELDKIFNQAREDNYQNLLDIDHRLTENYSKKSFAWAGIVANTIVFNDEGIPEICASIASRDCWPNDAYRILNRTWKATNKQSLMKEISQAMGLATISQIEWLEKNTDCELYFISRQTDNWMTWVSRNYKRQFNLDFKVGKNKYLTCPNECDDSCWQKIIYQGNEQILDQWKRRQ